MNINVDILCHLVKDVFDKEANKVNSEIPGIQGIDCDDKVAADGGFKCLHLGIKSFLLQLEAVLRDVPENERSKLKFLDVGCGVGQKVFLAKALFGLDSFGLEYYKPLFDKAVELTSKFRCNLYAENNQVIEKEIIFLAHALEFPKYNEFNIIYYFAPFAVPQLQAKLEEKIAREARFGAVVLEYFSHGLFTDENKAKEFGWKKLGNNAWNKVYKESALKE